MKTKKRFMVMAVSFLLLFALTACGAAADTGTAAGDSAELATLTPGKLTIATGEPAWEPWVLNDDPESGEGFEAAVAYAIAEKLGYTKENVVWVRTGFDEVIQPGPKTFDINIQQFSANEERRQAVDFSTPYYKEPLVVLTAKSNRFASATTLAELKDAVFGAAAGDIGVEYTKTAIDPTNEVQVFNDLAAVMQALDAGQIDAAVTAVTQADYTIVDEQVKDGVIIGSIPGSEDLTDGLAVLLEKDSPLTAAVSKAVDDLIADGTIQTIQDQFLGQYDVQELK